jgi:hypothetical protein
MNNSNIDMLVHAELGGGKEGGSTGKEDEDEDEDEEEEELYKEVE